MQAGNDRRKKPRCAVERESGKIAMMCFVMIKNFLLLI